MTTAWNMINNAAQWNMNNDTIVPRKYKLHTKTVESKDEETGTFSKDLVYIDNKEERYVAQKYSAKRMSRNAPLQRHILLSAFDLACRCIDDYLEASSQDDQAERSSMMY